MDEILDIETCKQCGQTSLRVAQGKFYEICVKTYKTCFDVVVVIIVVVAVVVH